MNLKKHCIEIAIIVFALLGIAASFYATLTSFGAASTEFCTISESFDCDVVTRSQYSKILGVPVAVLGLGSYLLMLGGIIAYLKTKNKTILQLMGTLAIVGFVFSLYLTGIEAFVLHTWCLLCITSQTAITALLVLILWLWKREG